MAVPQVEDGGTSPIWRLAANILNKQSQTAEKGVVFQLGVEQDANKSSP